MGRSASYWSESRKLLVTSAFVEYYMIRNVTVRLVFNECFTMALPNWQAPTERSMFLFCRILVLSRSLDAQSVMFFMRAHICVVACLLVEPNIMHEVQCIKWQLDIIVVACTPIPTITCWVSTQCFNAYVRHALEGESEFLMACLLQNRSKPYDDINQTQVA